MPLRKTADEREVAKLASAYERAERELAERERALVAAQAERDAAFENAAADAFTDGTPAAISANGKVERKVAEAMAARDAASAAVRGLRKRGSELAERVAEQKIAAAEKGKKDADVAIAETEAALVSARDQVEAADAALVQAQRESRYAVALFDPDVAARSRAAEAADEANVLAAVRGSLNASLLPAHLRERVPAARARRREEEERAREGYKRRVAAGEIRGIHVVDETGRGLKPGEKFPRIA